MKLYTVKSEGLSHNSYPLTDGQEAAVIDPRRDCKIYQLIASKACTKIRYIFETHRNEDYIVGSSELKAWERWGYPLITAKRAEEQP